MRNFKWLRYGIATASVIGLACAGTLAACGDDDDGATGSDAGKDNNVTPTDSGGTDSGGNDSGGDSGPKVPPAKIIVVHSATAYGTDMMGVNKAGSVRVCYATSTDNGATFTASPLPPLPHSIADGGAGTVPGIPIGAGGPFPSTGLPLDTIAIRPYVIDSVALYTRGIVGNDATLPRCNKLLPDTGVFVPDGGFDGGSDAGLEKNKHYWQLADIPKGTFLSGHTYVLAIFGCAADANPLDTSFTSAGQKCGGYTPTGTPGVGNLSTFVFEIDTTTAIANDELGVQVAQMSAAYDFEKDAAPSLIPKADPIFMNGIPDGGGFTDAGYIHISASGGSSEITFNGTNTKPTNVIKLKGVSTPTAWFAANDADDPSTGRKGFRSAPGNNTSAFAQDPDAASFSSYVPPSTQYLSDGKLIPNTAQLYVNGKRYIFFIVGDPAYVPTGSTDILRHIHYLGFESNFEPPSATE